jgi:hypothetical protein
MDPIALERLFSNNLHYDPRHHYKVCNYCKIDKHKNEFRRNLDTLSYITYFY